MENALDFIKTHKKTILYYTCLILFCFILSRKILLFAKIPSESMENTLLVGDHLVANRLAYLNDGPEMGDIIIFNCPVQDDVFIKRVIGTPGSVVDFRDGNVYVNGSKLEEPYVFHDPEYADDPAEEYEVKSFKVPEGCYFVMGDNRDCSFDSRYWWQAALDQDLASTKEEALQYTFVKKEDIIAKALFKYYKKFEMISHQDYHLNSATDQNK